MIITPNSALITEAKNPITAARYPCVRHFWKCDETSGLTLADTMGTCNIVADAMTFGDGYVDIDAAATTLDGTFDTIGTSPFLLIQVADGGTAGAVFGGSTDSISLVRSGSTAIYDATAAVDYDALTTAFATVTAGVVTARALVVKAFNGNMNSLNFNCSTDVYSAGTDTATTNTAQLAIPPTVFTMNSGNNAKLFGLAVMKFTTVPSDAELQAIVSWCGYYWSRGYKTLPPWLVGRV